MSLLPCTSKTRRTGKPLRLPFIGLATRYRNASARTAVKSSSISNIGRMVQMLNKVFIQGRMCADPVIRRTQSGTAVVSFTLAVERDFKDKTTGERTTDFIDCVAWRGTAEFVSRFFSKGRMAVVVGALQIRAWEDKEGNKRRTAEVIAESVYFGDSKRDADPLDKLADDSAPVSYPSSAGSPGEFAELTEDDGELPFK